MTNNTDTSENKQISAQLRMDEKLVALIRKDMTKPDIGNVVLKGRIIGILNVYVRANRTRVIQRTVLEENPVYLIFKSSTKVVNHSDVVTYQLKLDCYNKSRNSMPGRSTNPDRVIYTTYSDEELDVLTWDDLNKLCPYRNTNFRILVSSEETNAALKKKLAIHTFIRRSIWGMKLKFKQAANVNFFGESNEWQEKENECTQDFVKTLGPAMHSRYIKYLNQEDVDVSDGVALDTFCNFLHQEKCNFYILNPMLQVIDMHKRYNNSKPSAKCLLVNNDHIYPIVNKEFIRLCQKSTVGDTILSFDDLDTKDLSKCEIHPCTDLDSYVLALYGRTKMLPSIVSFSGTKVSSIKFNDKIHMCNESLSEVTEACERFGLTFENQSISKMCFQIMDKLAKLPHSGIMNDDALERFTQKIIAPYTQYFTEEIDIETVNSIDVCRFYTSLLYNKSDPYFFIDLDCDFVLGAPEQIDIGFYRLSRDVELCNKYVKIPSGTIISSSLLTYLVDSGYCGIQDISEYILSHRYMPNDYFKNSIKHLYENHSDSPILKKIVNSFIGWMGIYKSKKSRGFITAERSTAEAFSSTMPQSVIKSLGNLYTVTCTESKMLNQSYKPIWAQIICDSYIQLDKLVSDISSRGVVIHAIKTDCVVASVVEFPTKPKQPTIEQIGQAYNEESFAYHFKNYEYRGSTYIKPTKESKSFDEVGTLLEKNKSFALWGAAGTGKTYIVKNQIIKYFTDNNVSYRILSLAHLALKNYDEHTEVLASFFLPGRAQIYYDYLIIDEFSMVPMYFYEKLFKLRNSSKFILVGDYNQCLPVENKVFCRYATARFIRELVDDNIVTLTAVHRYDSKLHEACNKLINQGIVQVQLINTQEDNEYTEDRSETVQHLCYTNARCSKINATEFKKHRGSRYVPYMCVSNSGNLRNGDRLLYDRKDAKYVGGSVAPSDKLVLAYCLTVHKAQGQTINGTVIIHEANRMDKNLLYTAITRCTSYDKLFISGKVLRKYTEKSLDDKQDCSKFLIGGIYKIFNKDQQIMYVGCCEDYTRIPERIIEHKETKKEMTQMSKYSHKKVKYYHLSELYEAETKEIQAALQGGAPLINKQQLVSKTNEPVSEECFKFYSLVQPERKTAEHKIYVCESDVRVKLHSQLIKKFKVTKTRTIEQAKKLAEEYVNSLVGELTG